MRRNKIFIGVAAVMAALSLTACQNNKTSKTTAKSPTLSKANKKTAPKKLGTLKATGLSPQETVSVVTAYAGKKFGENWATVMNKAQQSKLEVTFDERSEHPSLDKGQGYVYVVGAEGADDARTYYTLEGDGESQVIYFYQGAKYLGQSTIKDIVKYLNKLNCDKLVQKLSNSAEVGGESASSSDSDSSNADDSSSKKSDLPGDAGIFTVPEKYRGTWYGYSYNDEDHLTTLTFTEHDIIIDGQKSELHKQDENWAKKKHPELLDDDSISKYSKAEFRKIPNIGTAITTYGWIQGAGYAPGYALHTEEGQTVLLPLDGSAGSLSTVLWKSKSLAEKYKGQHFDDLKSVDTTQNQEDSDDE